MSTCRECSCTDDNACLVSEVPCFWVEPNLCSSCAPFDQILAAPGGLGWVLQVCASVAAAMDRDATYAQQMGEPAIYATAEEEDE